MQIKCSYVIKNQINVHVWKGLISLRQNKTREPKLFNAGC